jgi:hypothetical protein
MPKKQQGTGKRPASKKLEVDVERNPQARITRQLLRQFEPYLPIESIEKILKEMDEVVVDKYRLPLKLFAPHIGKDLFPIRTAGELERKLADGVRRAVALARNGSIPVGNRSLIEILSGVFEEPVGRLRAPVRGAVGSTSAAESSSTKGGE